jgi:hypothetical protein
VFNLKIYTASRVSRVSWKELSAYGTKNFFLNDLAYCQVNLIRTIRRRQMIVHIEAILQSRFWTLESRGCNKQRRSARALASKMPTTRSRLVYILPSSVAFCYRSAKLPPSCLSDHGGCGPGDILKFHMSTFRAQLAADP